MSEPQLYLDRPREDLRASQTNLDQDFYMDVLVVMFDASPAVRRVVRYLAVEVWLKYGIYLSTRVWSAAHWREVEEMQTLLYRNIHRDGIRL